MDPHATKTNGRKLNTRPAELPNLEVIRNPPFFPFMKELCKGQNLASIMKYESWHTIH